MTRIKAIDVANVFIRLSDPELGDLITNLKVQKLLYYTQGYHLALYGKPMFSEDIVAWQYGPVVAEVYHELKRHGSNPIPVPDEVDTSKFTKRQLNLISEVNKVYGQFSAWKLKEMTHDEAPWKRTPTKGVISHEKLKSFFSQNIG